MLIFSEVRDKFNYIKYEFSEFIMINFATPYPYVSSECNVFVRRIDYDDGSVGIWFLRNDVALENGRLAFVAHRSDGPAYIQFASVADFLARKPELEQYFKFNELDREDGPAEIIYNEGKVLQETYYRHGKRHKSDGPAHIIRNVSGEAISTELYLNGEKVEHL